MKGEGQSKMPSSSSALGKQAAGGKPCEAAPSLLRTIKRSKASFKRGKRSKENVEPPFEPIGKLLQKSKVELCSLEKRLRCFRHKIGESKCENKTKKWKIPIILSFQVFLRRHAGGWSALARTLQVGKNFVSDGTICTTFCPKQPKNRISRHFTHCGHVRLLLGTTGFYTTRFDGTCYPLC